MRKLFLFDIDGTLISPGPVPRQILNGVFMEYVGQNPDLQLEDVAGFTDPLIIRGALRKCGVKNGDLGSLGAQILRRYLHELAKLYPLSDQPFLYRDALEFLDTVQQAGYLTALLTGNVCEGARIKLERFGLFQRFMFGVFGNDAVLRSDLPWVARERAWEHLAEVVAYRDMVIVGDTPSDARVAAENGARAIIVCRRPEWKDSIRQAGADLVVETLNQAGILSTVAAWS